MKGYERRGKEESRKRRETGKGKVSWRRNSLPFSMSKGELSRAHHEAFSDLWRKCPLEQKNLQFSCARMSSCPFFPPRLGRHDNGQLTQQTQPSADCTGGWWTGAAVLAVGNAESPPASSSLWQREPAAHLGESLPGSQEKGRKAECQPRWLSSPSSPHGLPGLSRETKN